MKSLCCALALCLCFGMSVLVHAQVAVIVPEHNVLPTAHDTLLKLDLRVLDPRAGALSLERPQTFSVIRHTPEGVDRSEHLSVLEEATLTTSAGDKLSYWTAQVALPKPGVYHFILRTKVAWQEDLDRFVQHIAKVQVPTGEKIYGWDLPAGLRLEIVPTVQPFGLCAGMAFGGQVVLDGKVMAGALVEAAQIDVPKVQQQSAKASFKSDVRSKTVSQAFSYSDVIEVRADGQGRFTFACPHPGWWVFAASMPGETLQNPDGVQKPVQVKSEMWVYINECKDKKH